MKFMLDAQLPRKLVKTFASGGHSAIHTLDLPKGNKSEDSAVADFADQESSIVVSKDSDFVDAHLLRTKPKRLLLISTGNINNADLEILVSNNMIAIESAFLNSEYVELSKTSVIAHG
jgi:predicted nuclease of predicted toxin-antitoxin system